MKKSSGYKISKRVPYGRILRSLVRGNREVSYHATKGYRSRVR